jgi:predicted dehydrogenase
VPTTVKVAVVGLGNIAQSVHLPLLRRRWDLFEITAVADQSARRRTDVGSSYKVPEDLRFDGVEALLAARAAGKVAVDAVVLATSGPRGADLLALLRQGLGVLVEPPIGLSAEEVADAVGFERMTGRRLVMLAQPLEHDATISRLAQELKRNDVRLVLSDVVQPSPAHLHRTAHVTPSSYDLDIEVRNARRDATTEALKQATGPHAQQKDRDLWQKGVVTGLVEQAAMLRVVLGDLVEPVAALHWPKGVTPGSLAWEGRTAGGGLVRGSWNYLPFAPAYQNRLVVHCSRSTWELELANPFRPDGVSRLSHAEKTTEYDVTRDVVEAGTSAPERMLEAFHAAITRGVVPQSVAADGLAQLAWARTVLDLMAAVEGRDLQAPVEPEEPEPAEVATDETATDETATNEAEVLEASVAERSDEPEPEGAEARLTEDEGTEDDDTEGEDAVPAEGTVALPTAVAPADGGPAEERGSAFVAEPAGGPGTADAAGPGTRRAD